MSAPVKLYVYDLTNGMARQLSLQLTGRQIDGIWLISRTPRRGSVLITIRSSAGIRPSSSLTRKYSTDKGSTSRNLESLKFVDE
jgi:hypothetical protein